MECPVCKAKNSLRVVVKEVYSEIHYRIDSEGNLREETRFTDIIDTSAYCLKCNAAFDEGLLELNREANGYPIHIVSITE